MNEQETKVVHELKLDKSIIKVMWVLAIALLLNALPNNFLISDAMAELGRNPTITILFGEVGGYRLDIDD
ncbi:MAG: hypothetical protein HOG42_03985 [Methylococcales bacterium]|jgi:hypothetical protein|nr:hypothetical protein [Methylococcales bacterium]